MKLKEFFLGTQNERAAIEKKGLKMTAFRFRMRQLLSVITIACAAYGMTRVLDRTPEETLTSPATPGSEKKVPEAKEFYVGPFIFIKGPDISDQEFQRIDAILKAAYPMLEEHIPVDEVQTKEIIIHRSNRGISFASYHLGEFQVTSDVSDGLIIHEFVHLLHGDKDLFYDLAEEGTATAFSILIPEALNMESWDRTKSLQINQTSKENLFLKPGIPYNSNPLMHTLRLESSAWFWIDLEKKQPGFIRDFHEAYYKFLNEGGKKEELYELPVLEKILRQAKLWTAFNQAMQEHPIAHPLPGKATEKVRNPHVYVKYIHFSNDGKKQLSIFIAKKEAPGEAELVLQRPQITFQFINLKTNQNSGPLQALGNEKGEVRLDLESSGEKFIESLCGKSPRYRVIIDAKAPEGLLHEEFEFDYP